jgi:glycosyltransferase involved in cell wall biosynthesis
MKYSIILPVRNGGSYIKECINSILQQTLNDFNLIVLDNCSTDGTTEWVNALRDPRIVVHPADRPLTIEENWGRITGVPKNEFITLIGHDDILDKNYLAVMDALIHKHPAASLYQTHFRYIDSKGALIRRCKPMDEHQSPAEFLSFFLEGLIDTMGTGFMMRAADYDAVGGIPAYPNLLFADFELWIGLTMPAYKATAIEECFAFRLHQSMTTTSPDVKMLFAFGRFIDYLQKLRSRDAALDLAIGRYAMRFIQFYCRSLSHRLLRTSRKGRHSLTVTGFVADCKSYADRLVPDNNFDFFSPFSMRMARFIDSNAFTRGLFLLFKKIYPTPLYT